MLEAGSKLAAKTDACEDSVTLAQERRREANIIMQQTDSTVAAMEDEVKRIHKVAEKRVDESQAAAQKTVFAERRHTATVISTKEAVYRKRIDSLISAHKEVVKAKD
eukprot:10311961-Ditylum_brightwellii.AAC.1